MMSETTIHIHMRRVRDYFKQMPPLRPETVDIVLRHHLIVPEELIPQAREEAAAHAMQVAPEWRPN